MRLHVSNSEDLDSNSRTLEKLCFSSLVRFLDRLGHQQLGSGGPLLIFEITMICVVLALLGGLLIGMYVEARRVKKRQKLSPDSSFRFNSRPFSKYSAVLILKNK